jgi:multicomponent Na+:H+ antiporter subunit A
MTGNLRHYLIYIFIFLISIVGGLTLRLGSWDFSQMNVAPISLYELLLVIVLIMAAMAIPFAKSRLQMIILVGTVGYMVALFFVIFRAPDLALTQMIVETVSVALFLLCFYHLPKLKQEKIRRSFQLVNALIAIGVGAVMTLVALSASGTRLFPPISDYFLRESYDSAGGNNVVNVILVDFRGFDTLLEIMVLGIAALGIYSLIMLNKTHKNKEGTHESQ